MLRVLGLRRAAGRANTVDGQLALTSSTSSPAEPGKASALAAGDVLPESRSPGRQLKQLAAPWTGHDSLFDSDRLNNQPVLDARYEHCTFTNISFLKARVSGGRFRNCTFVDCYFRDAVLSACDFTGCKFINCNFGHVRIEGGEWKYSKFVECLILYRDFRYALPNEPNLRMPLAKDLTVQAEKLGETSEARKYHLDYLNARKNHLLAGVKAETEWYQKHFKTVDRLGAAFQLVSYYFNSLLWKHGESAWRLLVSALLVSFVLFPLLYGVSDRQDSQYLSLLWLSLSNFFLLDRLSNVSLTGELMRVYSAVEALAGILFAGLYVTVLVKALLRR